MPLDGCKDDYISNGTYGAAGIDTDAGSNPDRDLDCVYWHVTLEMTDADFFGQTTLINIVDPPNSRIVLEPRCGTSCAEEAHGISHPLQVFANDTDPSYLLLIEWINDGAPF